MQAYARRLFIIAALFNCVVAAGLIALRRPLLPLLGLDPVEGSNVVFADISGVMIAVFAYAYWRVAQDAVRYRPYIELSVIGKLLVVLTVTLCWIGGHASWQLVALGGSDLVFTWLFIDYLRRNRMPADT